MLDITTLLGTCPLTPTGHEEEDFPQFSEWCNLNIIWGKRSENEKLEGAKICFVTLDKSFYLLRSLVFSFIN